MVSLRTVCNCRSVYRTEQAAWATRDCLWEAYRTYGTSSGGVSHLFISARSMPRLAPHGVDRVARFDRKRVGCTPRLPDVPNRSSVPE